MKRLPRLWRIDLGAARRRPTVNGRQSRSRMPGLEDLESRTVLSTIDWALTTGGSWDVGSDWVGGVVPGPSDTAVIKGLTGSNPAVDLNSGNADSVGSVITDSTVTLEVLSGSLTLGTASSSTFGGQVTVAQNAALDVGTGSSVTLAANQPFTDDGNVSFANDDTVSFATGSNETSEIVLNGTLNAAGTTFANSGTAGGSTTQVYVGTGGELIASSSTFDLDQLYLSSGSVLDQGNLSNDIFNLPLYVPAIDVPLLTLNQSFEAVNILGGTLESGQSTTLAEMGTKTSVNLYYVLPSGLSVASGATLTIGAGASVYLSDAQTLSVSGQLTVTDASLYVDQDAGYGGDSSAIVVNNGGTMTVADSSVVRDTACCNAEDTYLQVNTGGQLTASGSTFSLDNLYLDAGSLLNAGDITNNVFNTLLWTPVSDVPLLTDNQSFSGVFLTGNLVSGQSVSLAPMGTQTTAGLYYVIEYNMTVESGATLTIGTGARCSSKISRRSPSADS